MKRFIYISAILTLSISVYAQVARITPMPVSSIDNHGEFTLQSTTTVLYSNTSLKKAADYLHNYLHQYYDLGIRIMQAGPYKMYYKKNVIYMDITRSAIPGYYKMDVNDKFVSIHASSDTAAFYAIQSLIQLFPLNKEKSLQLQSDLILKKQKFVFRFL